MEAVALLIIAILGLTLLVVTVISFASNLDKQNNFDRKNKSITFKKHKFDKKQAEEKRRERLIELERGSYFERPEGMSDKEYTRKIVEMEAEKSGISPASPRLNIEPTGKIDPGFYTPRKEYPSYVSNRKKPPVIKIGPRGGRYTEDVTKEGRPYRRYC